MTFGWFSERTESDFWGFSERTESDFWGFSERTESDFRGFSERTECDFWGFLNVPRVSFGGFMNVLRVTFRGFLDGPTEKQALTTIFVRRNKHTAYYVLKRLTTDQKTMLFISFLACAMCMYLANHSLSFNFQVAGLENLASADPHSRLWQPEGQYMAEPSYVCRYVPKHQKPTLLAAITLEAVQD